MAIQTTRLRPAIVIDARYARLKRFFDILLSLLFLLPLCVLALCVAVLIRLDSPGSIFFKQKRVGMDGKEFFMYKFRSMYESNNDVLHREAIVRYMKGHALSESSAPGLRYKRVDDPRITRVGKILRKTSIDEIPQLINVLRGEMTLVGPRPALPYEVEMYSEYDRLRLCGKPGLTGYWQIYGRSRVPFRTMIDMDIAYLQRQSLREDLKLIALTLPVMLRGQGGA